MEVSFFPSSSEFYNRRSQSEQKALCRSACVLDTKHPITVFIRTAQEKEGLNVLILTLKILYCSFQKYDLYLWKLNILPEKYENQVVTRELQSQYSYT